MFRTYVRAASGSQIDFDRALLHMDGELLDASFAAIMDRRDTYPVLGADHGAQWIWDEYCARHRAKYGESFGLDVTPDWESSERAPEVSPPDAGPGPENLSPMIEPITSRLGLDDSPFVGADSGSWIKFDHASSLMDRELLDAAIAALKQDRPDEANDPQLVWEGYCKRHRERYGTPFGPNIVPGWDNPHHDPCIPSFLRPFGSGRIEISESIWRRVRDWPSKLRVERVDQQSVRHTRREDE